jgi:ribosomal protein L29
MKLIELLLTAACAVAGIGALMAGNCLEALLLWLLPIGFFLFVRIRKARKEEADRRAKQQEESDKFWAKERELRTKSDADLYNRHRAAQMQQMNMMHQNASQVSAAQQQAAMQSRQGWTDPRASYGSDLADNIVNLWAINSMVQSGTGVTRTHYDENTNSVKVQHVPTEQVYRSPDPEPSSSSSSSYSSDTSSDSYGGSDTSSDSF